MKTLAIAFVNTIARLARAVSVPVNAPRTPSQLTHDEQVAALRRQIQTNETRLKMFEEREAIKDDQIRLHNVREGWLREEVARERQASECTRVSMQREREAAFVCLKGRLLEERCETLRLQRRCETLRLQQELAAAREQIRQLTMKGEI